MKIINESEKIVIEKNGQEIECDLLFTFESDDTNKIYVGYTDNSIAQNGRKNIYVGSYDRTFGSKALEDIKTEQEMEMIRDVLEQIDKEKI